MVTALIPLQAEEEPKAETAEQVRGIVAKEITESVRERYKISEDIKGIFVTFVAPNSEAFTKFLRPGDIIQQLTSGNMKLSPKTAGDFHKFMADIKKAGKKKVLLLVNTQGNLRYVALSLEEEETEGETKEKITNNAPPKVKKK